MPLVFFVWFNVWLKSKNRKDSWLESLNYPTWIKIWDKTHHLDSVILIWITKMADLNKSEMFWIYSNLIWIMCKSDSNQSPFTFFIRIMPSLWFDLKWFQILILLKYAFCVICNFILTLSLFQHTFIHSSSFSLIYILIHIPSSTIVDSLKKTLKKR